MVGKIFFLELALDLFLWLLGLHNALCLGLFSHKHTYTNQTVGPSRNR